jgi:ABC-type phosphate transport system substrate-binding protein
VVGDTVQLGVTDVEPALLIANDFPSNYSAAAFGTATPAQMKALPTVRLYDQVFGLVVNKSGQTFSQVNLTRESAANIILGNYSDWSNVPDAISGAPISSAPSEITRINREPGSGTRTSTNVFLFGYHCGSAVSMPNPQAGEVVNFSTGEEMNAVNSTPGSIAYASIDQILNPANGTKFTNVILASIDGVAPSNQAAATGRYGWWFEATLVPETGVTGGSLALSQYLQTSLPKVANLPSIPSVLAIPGVGGNVPATPLNSNGGTGTAQVFVNPYSRAGNSCAVPGEQI